MSRLSEVISVRVPQSIYETLVAEAAKLDWPVSQLARRILVDWSLHVMRGPPDEKDFPLFWSDAPPAEQLPYALLNWLRSPEIHIKLSPGDEIQQLRSEAASLQAQVEKLKSQLQRAEMLYAQECTISMSLQDQLRSLGVKFRR